MSAEKHSFKAAIKTEHHKKHIVVTGKVEEPTNSWTVSLTKANPQGINPKILMLKLNEVPPKHAAGDIVTTYPVSFDESVGDHHFTEVTIETKGSSFTIPVH